MAADDVGPLELEVGPIAAGGACVARAPGGQVVFVRHALPGERVRVRVTATASSFLRADAVEVLDPSPDRVAPPCPYAGPGRCGGCDFQHVAPEAQRRLKAVRIAEQLAHMARTARTVEVEAVAGDRRGLGWRSRVRLAVDADGAVGFRRHRSHAIEPVDSCPVATAAVLATGAFAARWPGVSRVEVATATGFSPGAPPDQVPEAVVTVVPRRPRLPALPDVRAGLVVRGVVRRPPGAVHATVLGNRYRVSAGVFWQVHQGAAEALVEAVLEVADVHRGSRVVDLYAGAGLFSVPLAQAAGPDGSVLAVERDAAACADARHNGAGLDTLRVLHQEVNPALVAGGIGRPDLVVLDPARQGAGTAVMEALASHATTVRRLVYVACDPASFARDARVLLQAGWELTTLRALDIFPMTEHVETVAAFTPSG